ncbi:MAG TPA: hypothetical protein VFE42_21440 [Chloroflexota bacterium]|nr:hypothetical protein [Chloroflexota bacterium]
MWQSEPDRRPTSVVRARWPLIIAAVIAGAILQYLLAGAPPTQAPARPSDLTPTAAHQSAPARMPSFLHRPSA